MHQPTERLDQSIQIIRQTRTAVVVLLAALFTAFSVPAWSDCACFCVEGKLATMCTEADEAQNRPNLCPAAESASCSQAFSTEGAATYDAPSDAAVNCRDIQVYDAVRGQYVTARACDVI